MSDTGIFTNLVSTASCLAAAGIAIRLAWMRRAKWQPPEESVPEAVSRMSGLIAMVFIALIYAFGQTLGVFYLAMISILTLLISILALAATIYTSTMYSFEYIESGEKRRLLGGSALTDEARNIKIRKKRSETDLIIDARGQKDLVWTRSSIALIATVSSISFITVISLGTTALAAAAMLFIVLNGQSTT